MMLPTLNESRGSPYCPGEMLAYRGSFDSTVIGTVKSICPNNNLVIETRFFLVDGAWNPIQGPSVVNITPESVIEPVSQDARVKAILARLKAIRIEEESLRDELYLLVD